MTDERYTVVENAGYEGETDIRSFPTRQKAENWIKRRYYADERDPHHPNSLHVEIRHDWTDAHGDEHGEYV